MAKDSILRLRVESSEYDAKLKRATEGLQHMAKAAHDMGGQLTNAEKDEVAFIRGMGQMNTVSKTAAGGIREMESSLKAMTLTYKQMSDYEKQGDVGKALAASMSDLKGRLITAKQALFETEKEMAKLNQQVKDSLNPMGQFGGMIDQLGNKVGITGNLSEILTSKTALLTSGIGAGVAIVGKATEAWASYNAELAKKDQITTVTTGLKGDDANRMTDQARALSDTYNVDFREAINAANTLMTQFGQTGEQAMSLIRDGMQGMIQGDGPKLLSMIQQYAPAFRDAGVSASQLVAVIQNSEGGIFTDQNMNAIVMGIKNIRLMTNATSEALAKIGINGEEMTRKLNDGSMSIFDALKKVAQAVEGTSSSSKAAGEVMQQVFGRQGAMAGTKLGEAIASLNLNLEETKRQTGEVGKAYDDLYDANVRLNGAIRDCFEYDGWDQMATGIKANLVNALAVVLESCKSIYDKLADIGALKVFDFIASSVLRCVKPFGLLYDYARKLFAELGGGTPAPKENKPTTGPDGAYYETKDASGKVIERGHWKNGKTVKDVTENEFDETKPLPVNLTRTRTGSRTSRKQSTADMLLSSLKKANSKIDAASLMDTTTNTGSALFQMLKAAHQAEMPTTATQGEKDAFENRRKEVKAELKKNDEEKNKKDKDAVEVADQIYGGVSSMVSSLEQMGIELPEGFKNMVGAIGGVIGVLQSIMMIVNAIQAVQEVGTFLGLFKNGGIVPHAQNGLNVVGGTHYSGDITPILANAGEVVLNRSQVSNLASALQSPGMQNMKLEAIVSGEQLRFVLNNNGRRTGRGEYVQSTRRS